MQHTCRSRRKLKLAQLRTTKALTTTTIMRHFCDISYDVRHSLYDTIIDELKSVVETAGQTDHVTLFPQEVAHVIFLLGRKRKR